MVAAPIYILSSAKKQAIMMAVDSIIVPISLYCAFALSYETINPWVFISNSWLLFGVITALGVGIFWSLGLHRIKIHAFDNHSMLNIGMAAALLALSAMVLSYLLGLSIPRSVPLLLGMLFCFFAVFIRAAGPSLLRWLFDKGAIRKPIAIYGAGASGIQLADAFRHAREVRPVFFVDDDPDLHGLMVAGLHVYSPCKLSEMIERRGIEQILLACPSLSKECRDKLISDLSVHNVEVRVLHSCVDLVSNHHLAPGPHPVSQDKLLKSDKAILDTPDVAKTYAGRVIMVTGAGRAIGSELCRQLLKCNPERIILFERGEFQLRSIRRELQTEASNSGISLVSRLGSVTDKAGVVDVIAEEGVDIIIHAAAYKNAPLIESNELEGARNNVLGTQVVAEAAAAAKLERFILVSPDKTGRPISIMSATNRMAELVLQDMQARTKVTRFATVRAGNLLDSSQSGLPLAQKQIGKSGPAPVIHKNLVRPSTATPEAAGLALLAGAYANGGEVFVLDREEPQKVTDTSHRVVVPFDRRVKAPSAVQRSILKKAKGYFSEEELHQEFPIDGDNFLPTPHAKIRRVQEVTLSQIEVASMLHELQVSIAKTDTVKLRQLIAARVVGYHFQSDVSLLQ